MGFYDSKTCWRVVVRYESIDGRQMRMWSKLMTQDRALKLKSKVGNGAYLKMDSAVTHSKYNTERFPLGWCEELPPADPLWTDSTE